MAITARRIFLWHEGRIRRKRIGYIGVDRNVVEPLQLPIARYCDICPIRSIKIFSLETSRHFFGTGSKMEFPFAIQQLQVGRQRSVAGESQLGIRIRAHGHMSGSFVFTSYERIFPIPQRRHVDSSISKFLNETDLPIEIYSLNDTLYTFPADGMTRNFSPRPG